MQRLLTLKPARARSCANKIALESWPGPSGRLVIRSRGNSRPLTHESVKVESARSGFVVGINTEEVGHAIAEAGGGRVRIEDRIDPTVGFLSEGKIGSEVRSGDSIGLLYCSDQDRAQRAAARIQAAYVVEDGRPSKLPELIKEVIDK